MALADAPTSSVPLLPAGLPLLRTRIMLRLLESTRLPAYKGALLRGGFGYAFQRATCPPTCWGHSRLCPVTTVCPYRWVFETPHPPGVAHLHDLRDVPRPFVIELPLDGRTSYAAGDPLEFVLVLIGQGIQHLPHFLFGFEQLGQLGLGRDYAKARLERVEALTPWQTTGPVIYQDGQVRTDGLAFPVFDAAILAERAALLPADLQLTLHTPLRLKAQGDFLRRIEPVALVQAVCWRLNALATFHGSGPWDVDYRPLVTQARTVAVEQEEVQWVDWERTSTRGGQRQTMKLGGIVGEAVLRGVPPEVRLLLLAGSIVHVGKACVFGHGQYTVKGSD